VQTLRDTIRAVVDHMPDLTLAVLFGSAARGSAASGSDVDVGVLYRGEVTADSLSSLFVILERATGRRIDLVPLNTAPPLLRFEVARDGVLLLERAPNAWSTFRAKAMVDWWDWAPTARIMFRAAAAGARLATHASGPARGETPHGPA
jgi:predicted nucleotidyltransferase